LVVASVFLTSVFARPARSEQDPPAEAKPIAVETVRRDDFRREKTYSAVVQAFDAADLAPRLSGYLKRLNVDIGASVRRGQVLAEIDAPELAAELEKAEALVDQAEARITRAKAAVTVAEAALSVADAQAETAASVQQRAESSLSYREKALARSQG